MGRAAAFVRAVPASAGRAASSPPDRSREFIALRPAVLTLILAATAVPIELRRPALSLLNFEIIGSDVLANIAGFMPLGMVLAEMGRRNTIASAALL